MKEPTPTIKCCQCPERIVNDLATIRAEGWGILTPKGADRPTGVMCPACVAKIQRVH